MSDRLFPESQPLIVYRPGTVSKRTEEQRRRELRRLGVMHATHGHGTEGQQCRDCEHLIRKSGWRGNGGKSFLKCELYARDGYAGTDWRARWPACGQFTRKAVGCQSPVRDMVLARVPGHDWTTKRLGGDPAEATSLERVTVCDRCGVEQTDDNAFEGCHV